MEELSQQQLPGTQPKRPVFLTVLCILTFIYSGTQLFSNLLYAFFYALFHEQVMQAMQEVAKIFKLPGLDLLRELSPVFFLISGILYAGAFVGAFLMMRLKKTGFHIYTIFQILLFLCQMYFMHQSSPVTGESLFSALFITLYSLNLKSMT